MASAISLAVANLLPVPVNAAIIEVSGNCTLADAIISANTDGVSGGCASTAGSGHDTLVLQNSRMLSYIGINSAYDADGHNALPSITSIITIQGNGSTIERSNAPGTNFRLIHVASSGYLRLNELTLTGGVEWRPARGLVSMPQAVQSSIEAPSG